MNMQVETSDASRTADIAQQIDDTFANSPNATQSITEKAALDVSNSGVDIATVDREIALAGMFMVLFLTANGIAQAVRERFAEFATLKTIGFSDRGVIGAGVRGSRATLPAGRGARRGAVGLAARDDPAPDAAQHGHAALAAHHLYGRGLGGCERAGRGAGQFGAAGAAA